MFWCHHLFLIVLTPLSFWKERENAETMHKEESYNGKCRKQYIPISIICEV